MHIVTDNTSATKDAVTYADITDPLPKRRKMVRAWPLTPFPFKSDLDSSESSAKTATYSPYVESNFIDLKEPPHQNTSMFKGNCMKLAEVVKTDICAEIVSYKDQAILQVKDVTKNSLKVYVSTSRDY